MHMRKPAALLLTAVMALGVSAHVTPAMASNEIFSDESYEENLQQALSSNKIFVESHDDQMVGTPFIIPDKARTLSAEIVGSETDPYQKAKLIYDWMVTNSHYDENYEIADYFTSNYHGVCDGFAKAFQEMCWAQNIPCLYYGGICVSPGSLQVDGHAWNAFFANGEWHFVDVTWGNTGGGNQFDMSIEKLTEYTKNGGIRSISYIYTHEDVDDWAADDVTLAFANGLLPYSCTEDWTHNYSYVDYQSDCSRKSFAQMAVALLEVCYDQDIDQILADQGVTAGSFTDTDDPAVLAANALGIVNGYGNGAFGPEASITRQEAAAILARTADVLDLPAGGGDLSVFADRAQIGDWAADSVAVCSALGVMQGTTATTFSPLSPYTREQCVVTMERLFEAAQA